MRILLMLCPILVSCATPGGHTLIGAASGSVAGLIAQRVMRTKNPQSVALIMLLGSGLGAAGGYYSEEKSAVPDIPAADLNKVMAPFSPIPAPPSIVPPTVDSYYVDDQVRGTTFVPGHMEYRIKEPAKWQRYEANPVH